MSAKILPICPGEVLREEYLKPMGLKQTKVAKDLGLSSASLSQFLSGKTRLGARLAIGLSKIFGNSPEFWMNLQTRYELEMYKIKEGYKDAPYVGEPYAAELRKERDEDYEKEVASGLSHNQ